ncbi:unnamed protein product [Clonostachys rosea f. rosea IK726]|uniref:Uncharacterized protein n=1 Tax=Clonostachys rosea f. rosea IK726 TaxID=1349383 RepID=A0ACA9TBM3_BIOOC|nr:unnamed protein product [Clonostachys rosea f. rosea IK726]
MKFPGTYKSKSWEPASNLIYASQSANYIHRYFSQRYSIFSWYDQGICMTDDAWFGVTPEPVAKYGWLNSSLSERGADISRPIFSQVAKDMYDSDAKKTVLIDMFAGAGGNTIAFALSGRWSQIIAVEKDASTLACAQNNADVYGVERPCITWVHGDSLEFLDILVNRPEELHPDLRVDLATTVVFASPPWGGVGYSSDQVFDLYTMQPYDLRQLHNACYPMDHALYLPRSSDIRQIAKLAPEGEKIEVVQYCMEGASKAMVAYIPAKNIPEKS